MVTRSDRAASEPLPVEVGQFANFEARMLRTFRVAVEDWDEVCSALGAWEAQHLTREDDGPALEQHRRWVMALLAWGRMVQRATQPPEFPDPTLATRVAARVRHLQDKLDLWHGEMSLAAEARIFQTAFA